MIKKIFKVLLKAAGIGFVGIIVLIVLCIVLDGNNSNNTNSTTVSTEKETTVKETTEEIAIETETQIESEAETETTLESVEETIPETTTIEETTATETVDVKFPNIGNYLRDDTHGEEADVIVHIIAIGDIDNEIYTNISFYDMITEELIWEVPETFVLNSGSENKFTSNDGALSLEVLNDGGFNISDLIGFSSDYTLDSAYYVTEWVPGSNNASSVQILYNAEELRDFLRDNNNIGSTVSATVNYISYYQNFYICVINYSGGGAQIYLNDNGAHSINFMPGDKINFIGTWRGVTNDDVAYVFDISDVKLAQQ